ncbi:MAG: AI-2E family transporter [Candidatus Nanoarchaeia archaeon]|nr:AI-2E family transporter [Candidatus Nanoarchaeia archaeon]
MKDEIKNRNWYLFMAVFIFVLYLSFLVIKPFLVSIIAAFVLTYFLYPIYKWIRNKISNKNLAAFLTVFLVIVIVVVPLFFIISSFLNDAIEFFQFLKNFDWSFLNSFLSNQELIGYIKTGLQDILKVLIQSSASFILSLPQKILNIFVLFFVMFFTFLTGEDLLKKIKDLLPVKEDHKIKIFDKSKMALSGFFYGLILIAFIQAIILSLLFFVFNLIGLTNIGSIFLLGFLTFIFAVLPVVGPAFVWVPVVLIEITKGNVLGGILLTILCFGIVYLLMDLIIKPKVLGDKSNIHPVLVLIGGLGGIILFGVMGILLGPLILALLEIFVEIFLQERDRN